MYIDMYIPDEIQNLIKSYLLQCNNCTRLCIYKATSRCNLCKKFWCLKCNNCVINRHITSFVPCCYTCRINNFTLHKYKLSPWLVNYNYYN